MVLSNQKTLYKLFSNKVLRTKENTPPMPLLDAHLGGLLF